MQRAVITTEIPSVRPSVCLSDTRWYYTQMNEDRIMRSSLWGSNKTVVFWYQQWLGRRPIPLKIYAQSDPPRFEKRRLRQISAYNVSTVAKKTIIIANRKSAIRFPMSYRWSVYVTPKSPKGGSKSKFVIFVNKNQFKSNKLCYKESLCETFQRQSCSRTIPLSNGVYVGGKRNP